jgi:uncharacterized protein
MSPQESKLLSDFLAQLVAARGIQKDREADGLIQRAARDQPDALYLLVQRAMIQQQALDVAQQRIAHLESALAGSAQPAGSGSFLAGSSWGRSANERTAPRELAPAAAATGQGYERPPGRSGGLLGQIAATAAGVAGGAFLFHGIESLLGHHAGAAGATGFLNPGGFSATADTGGEEAVQPGDWGSGDTDSGATQAADVDSADFDQADDLASDSFSDDQAV